jgi:branched-chain amino acid transport system substrate-binding protein
MIKNKLKKFIFATLTNLTALGFLLPVTAQQMPVTIGIPLPLSGDFKEFGIMMKNSFEMAQESVNEAGGINGRSINIVFADDEGKVASVKSAFDKLVAANPVMLVGGYASDPTYQLARMAQEANLPFLVCTASADKITQRGWKNIYRLNPPVSEYTKGLEDFWIKNYRPKSMAIINENSMFGTSGAIRMIEFCRDKAIEIRAHINYDPTLAEATGYFRSLLAPLTEEPPDVIYMIAYLKDAVALVKQLREYNIKSLLCGGAGGFTLEEFIIGAGGAANYLLTAALWSEHVRYPKASKYYTQYVERYSNSPDYHGAEAYSALLVAAEALKRSKSFRPQDIRDALNQLYMMTPFGPVKFYSYEDFERQNSINTLVLQIINGKFETIWPLDAASARFVLPQKNDHGEQE